MSELSPSTGALLRAAKSDGPGAASRATIWNGVSVKAATSAAAGAGATGAVVSAATAKLLVMGALLGSTVTVGIAAFALRVTAPTLRADPTDVVHADTEVAVAPATRGAVPVDELGARPAAPRHAPTRTRAPAANDSLDREATLVAEARGALVRGEPQAALGALRAARALPGSALEPEELALEVRALRALGKSEEASAVEDRLRTRFPDHALAR